MTDRDRASGDLTNEVSAEVHGPVVQGRDFTGDLHFTLQLPERATRVPHELPPRPRPFVNRESELAAIDRLLEGSWAPTVVLLRGAAGIGKSAIGCFWAHLHQDQFPEGQLYVDFREHRRGEGSAIATIIAELLRSLGEPDDLIPPTLGERVRRFRSVTADKRLLMLLDDVRQASEVIQLLPPSPGSVVIVTSGRPLREVFRHGGRAVELTPLDRGSATSLLCDLIGDDRARHETTAVDRLSAICGGLPIALSVCGARLADTGHSVSWLADLLEDETDRLNEIEYEEGRSLRVVFDEGYSALGTAAQTMYRALGSVPGTSVTAVTAAVAANVTLPSAGTALGELAAARLIEPDGERYRQHDLLRAHARVTALEAEPEAAREQVVARVITHYVAATQRMDRAIAADRLRLSEPPPSPLSGEEPLRHPIDALGWFEAERSNVQGVLRAAYDRELDEAVWMIGEALWLAYRGHGHWDEAADVFGLATQAAHRLANVEAEARLRSQLARALIELGDHERAAQELATCRALMQSSPHRPLAASIIEWTGVLHLAQGQLEEAVAAFDRALTIFQQAGVDRGVVMQRFLRGRALAKLGQSSRAVDDLRWAAARVDRETDQFLFGRVQWRLGEALLNMGQLEPARIALLDAVTILRRHSAQFHEAEARETLAALERAAGDRDQERVQLECALAIYSEFGLPQSRQVSLRLAELSG